MTIGHLQLTPSKRRLQFPSNLWLTLNTFSEGGENLKWHHYAI